MISCKPDETGAGAGRWQGARQGLRAETGVASMRGVDYRIGVFTSGGSAIRKQGGLRW